MSTPAILALQVKLQRLCVELISVVNFFDELANSLEPASSKQQPASIDVSRSSDDWVAELMAPSTQAMMQEQYGHCKFVTRSLIQFFVIEKMTFWQDDEKMESHGKASGGSRRMEPRWHRRLNVALCEGQKVPGFPLQKVRGTKDKFKLIMGPFH
jgi:hypothetical protein